MIYKVTTEWKEACFFPSVAVIDCHIKLHLKRREEHINMSEKSKTFTERKCLDLRVHMIHFLSAVWAQMRKMMSSATMTWLSSCMRARASRTSGSVKRFSRPLLTSSIRVFIFTDCA